VVSQLFHELYARRDGGKEMIHLHTLQHAMKQLHDDAMRVRHHGKSPLWRALGTLGCGLLSRRPSARRALALAPARA